MTTTHAQDTDLIVRRPLQQAAAAVADADRALSRHDDDALRSAALVLAGATHEVLAELDRRDGPPTRPDRLKEVLGWWHQQLDEARLQVALAEMEAHGAQDELVLALERRFVGVTDLISTSVERIGMALTSLRREVQAYGGTDPGSGPRT